MPSSSPALLWFVSGARAAVQFDVPVHTRNFSEHNIRIGCYDDVIQGPICFLLVRWGREEEFSFFVSKNMYSTSVDHSMCTTSEHQTAFTPALGHNTLSLAWHTYRHSVGILLGSTASLIVSFWGPGNSYSTSILRACAKYTRQQGRRSGLARSCLAPFTSARISPLAYPAFSRKVLYLPLRRSAL